MRISIRHQLSATPPAATANAVLQLLLTPQSGPTQKVESWSVEMAGIDTAGVFTDAFGNTTHLVNTNKPEGALLITVEGVVHTNDRHGVLGRPGGEPVPALYRRLTGLTKAPVGLYGKFRGSKDSRLDILHALMARVGEALGAPVDTLPPMQAQTLMGADGMPSMTQSQGGMGQSQSQGQAGQSQSQSMAPKASDYAHAFIGSARALDIPARYVTGYLFGAEDEQTAFHAWAEAYDEGLGWIGFDPLLQLCPTDRHVRLAMGLDALGAQAVRMIPAGEGIEDVLVSVDTGEA